MHGPDCDRRTGICTAAMIGKANDHPLNGKFAEPSPKMYLQKNVHPQNKMREPDVKGKDEYEREHLLKEISDAHHSVWMAEIAHEKTKQSFRTARMAWDTRTAQLSDKLEAAMMELEAVKRDMMNASLYRH